jgi:hypothetical protein
VLLVCGFNESTPDGTDICICLPTPAPLRRGTEMRKTQADLVRRRDTPSVAHSSGIPAAWLPAWLVTTENEGASYVDRHHEELERPSPNTV